MILNSIAKKSCLSMLAFSCLTAASWGNIFGNKSTDTCLAALNCTSVTGSGVASPAGSCWSELSSDSGDFGTFANNIAGYACRSQGVALPEFRLADDFTVSGGVFFVKRFKAYAYRSGPTSGTSLMLGGNVNLLTGAPNAGGVLIASTSTFSQSYQIPVSVTGGVFTTRNVLRIFSTTAGQMPAPTTTRQLQECRLTFGGEGIALGPGTYWVDFQLNQEVPPVAPFAFAVTTTHPGTRTPPGGGNALQRVPGGAWAPVIDTGDPIAGPDIPQDMAFVLEGFVQRFPDSYSILVGTPFGGSLPSLFENDDDYVSVLCDEFGPEGVMQCNYTTGISFTSTVRVRLESNSTRDDQSEFVQMFNWSTNSWVTVGSYITSLTDVMRTLPIVSASSYVSSSKQVRVRLRTVPNADVETSDGWSNQYDYVHVICNP